MRVAIVSPYLTSRFGPESLYNVQALGLARSLASRGIHVEIFTSSHYRDSPQIATGPSVRTHYLNSPQMVPNLPTVPPDLVSRVRDGHFDVVQCTEDWQPWSLALGKSKLRHRGRLIVYQGLYRIPPSARGRMYFGIHEHLFLPMMRDAVDLAIAKTSEAEVFMRGRGYSNVARIPVGIDTALFSPREKQNARRVLGLPEHLRLVGYVGRLSLERDPLSCVSLLAALSPGFSDVGLVMVGTGPDKGRIEAAARREGVLDRVIFKQGIHNSLMPQFYSAMDVVYLPMRRETVFTFGMVLTESLACGTPVISAPVPAAIDLIRNGQNGFIVDFTDISAAREHCMNILLDPDLQRRLSTQARESALELDWTVLASRFVEAYQRA